MILAIDPGTALSSWVVIDRTAVIEAVDQAPNERVISKICILRTVAEARVVCENIQSFGMAVGQETFDTAIWIGEFRRQAKTEQVPFHLVNRKDVKLALCHSLKAKPTHIRQALLDRYGGKATAVGRKRTPGPLYGIKGHCWSALALAVAWMELCEAPRSAP